MSNKLEIDRVILQDLIEEQEGTDDFTYVDSIFDGEWRWGLRHNLIFKDSADNYWEYSYKESTGDEFWASYQEGEEAERVTVDRVIPLEIKSYVYRKAT